MRRHAQEPAEPAARFLDLQQQTLWKDTLGQISLGTTTLFWGVSGNLRYIVLAWAAAALGYSVTAGLGAGRRGGYRYRRRCGGGFFADAPGAGR